MEEEEEKEIIIAKEGESVFKLFRNDEGGSFEDYFKWKEEL